MIIIHTDTPLYHQIRQTFTQHQDKHNQEYNHHAFKHWLNHHGGIIEPDPWDKIRGINYICDSLGIVPGKHRIVFEHDPDYVIFALRLS